MSISALDIKFYYPEVTGYSNTSGGKMSTSQFDPSVTGAVIPPLTVQQAQAGGDFYTKFFMSLENADNTPMFETYYLLSGYDSNTDSFLYASGTETDITSDAQGYTDWKCGFTVDADLTAGATSIPVTFETVDVFLNATEYVWVSDGTNTELIKIDNSSNGSIVSNHPTAASISLTVAADYNGGNGIINAFSGTIVGGVAVPVGTLEATLTDLVLSGTVVQNDNISVFNDGTMNESFVLEFTGATTFKIRDGADATKYYDASGNVTDSTEAAEFDVAFNSMTYLPNPSRAGTNRFGLPQNCFTDATAGDTVSFTTHGAMIPIWIKRVVPANTPSAIETITLELIGQGL